MAHVMSNDSQKFSDYDKMSHLSFVVDMILQNLIFQYNKWLSKSEQYQFQLFRVLSQLSKFRAHSPDMRLLPAPPPFDDRRLHDLVRLAHLLRVLHGEQVAHQAEGVAERREELLHRRCRRDWGRILHRIVA